MIPSRFVFSQIFENLKSHGTFKKIVIKVQKSVRYHSHFRLKTCPNYCPDSSLFLCPLPLKVSASCGGGHSKWAYISYWDLGRIKQNFNWAQLNRIQGFRQAYCDSRSHYLKLLCHSYLMNLCRVCARVLVLLPHSTPQSTARYHSNNIGVLISSKLVEDWGNNNRRLVTLAKFELTN